MPRITALLCAILTRLRLRQCSLQVGGGFLVVVTLSGFTLPGPEPDPGTPAGDVLVPGEELIYNVRYGFIDLGQVRILTRDRVRVNGHTAYNGEAVIQSYKGVPFVDLHALYFSLMDSAGFSHRFVGKTREDGNWSFSRYQFQYENHRILLEMGANDTLVEQRDTMSLEGPYHDGLSLFFYARDQLFSGKQASIPTLVKEKKGITFIDFKGTHRSVESDFIDYPVDVVGFDGNMGFVGVFGLTGDFEGWFSNDSARIPIVATMKVIIGSVTLELVKWTRPGWSPPRAKEE